jgi:hypothetical protein
MGGGPNQLIKALSGSDRRKQASKQDSPQRHRGTENRKQRSSAYRFSAEDISWLFLVSLWRILLSYFTATGNRRALQS